MQKNSRHFWDVRRAKLGGFAGEEKQFSQPARPRKLLDQRVKASLTLRLSIFNSGVPF
jgi:hypothetical protein